MTVSLILDILVAVLLSVTIWYSTVLNRRLNALRSDKKELDQLTSSFGEATLRAGDSIVKLKNTADDLKDRIEKAGSLRDDLQFLVERSAAAADRLEKVVRAARVHAESVTHEATIEKLVPAAKKRTPVNNPVESRSEAERELIKALQSVR